MLVSIITPTYNCLAFLKATIQSVLDQTFSDWELLIQDDCSTDGTECYVRELAQHDSRIKYERNSTSLGAALTRNNAIRRASGKYIAFLDSDDLWLPTKLERQVGYMKEYNYAFTYTNYAEINETGIPLGKMVSGPSTISRKLMLSYCWPGCLTVMYDSSVVGCVQIRDIKKNNDYAMWLMISKKADCHLLDECLAQYRRGRSGSVSSQKLSTLIMWHYKLFCDAEGMSIGASIFFTIINLFCGIYKKAVYVKKPV